jgi:hypothetical protein
MGLSLSLGPSMMTGETEPRVGLFGGGKTLRGPPATMPSDSALSRLGLASNRASRPDERESFNDRP